MFTNLYIYHPKFQDSPWHAVGTGRVVLPGVADALQCLLLADSAGGRGNHMSSRRRIWGSHKIVVQLSLMTGIVDGGQMTVHVDGLRLTRLVLALRQQGVDAEGLLGLTLGGWQESGSHGGSAVVQVVARRLWRELRRSCSWRCGWRIARHNDRSERKTWQGIGSQRGMRMWHVMWRWGRESLDVKARVWRRWWTCTHRQGSHQERHSLSDLVILNIIRWSAVLGTTGTQSRSIGAEGRSCGGRRVAGTRSRRTGTGIVGLGSGRQCGVAAALVVVLGGWRGSLAVQLVAAAAAAVVLVLVLVDVAQQELRRHRGVATGDGRGQRRRWRLLWHLGTGHASLGVTKSLVFASGIFNIFKNPSKHFSNPLRKRFFYERERTSLFLFLFETKWTRRALINDCAPLEPKRGIIYDTNVGKYESEPPEPLAPLTTLSLACSLALVRSVALRKPTFKMEYVLFGPEGENEMVLCQRAGPNGIKCPLRAGLGWTEREAEPSRTSTRSPAKISYKLLEKRGYNCHHYGVLSN